MIRLITFGSFLSLVVCMNVYAENGLADIAIPQNNRNEPKKITLQDFLEYRNEESQIKQPNIQIVEVEKTSKVEVEKTIKPDKINDTDTRQISYQKNTQDIEQKKVLQDDNSIDEGEVSFSLLKGLKISTSSDYKTFQGNSPLTEYHVGIFTKRINTLLKINEDTDYDTSKGVKINLLSQLLKINEISADSLEEINTEGMRIGLIKIPITNIQEGLSRKNGLIMISRAIHLKYSGLLTEGSDQIKAIAIGSLGGAESYFLIPSKVASLSTNELVNKLATYLSDQTCTTTFNQNQKNDRFYQGYGNIYYNKDNQDTYQIINIGNKFSIILNDTRTHDNYIIKPLSEGAYSLSKI